MFMMTAASSAGSVQINAISSSTAEGKLYFRPDKGVETLVCDESYDAQITVMDSAGNTSIDKVVLFSKYCAPVALYGFTI